MACQIENLDITLPQRFAVENFFHRHSADMLGVGFVQVKNDLLYPDERLRAQYGLGSLPEKAAWKSA